MKRILRNRMAAMLAPCLFFAAAYGQMQSPAAYRDGDRLRVRITLDNSDADVSANERLTVTPVVTNGRNAEELAPVVFTGRIRRKVDERLERLYGIPAEPEGAMRVVVLQRRSDVDLPTEYVGSIPYEPWMAGGNVVLLRELAGCAGHTRQLATQLAARIAAPVAPHLTFLVPADDSVKRRSEQITAIVHFPQGRSVLLRGFADNRAQLGRIDSLTARLLGADSLPVEAIYLRGYASPEGAYAFNTRLSANRARTIRRYLEEKFGIDETLFSVSTVPEDWDSLRRWVAASDLPARAQILAVIDRTSDPDARDARIRNIDGGATYRKLLEEVYPQLRRVDYRIAYTVPAYSTGEAETVIAEHPEWLSLAEICRLAASYPEDSPERAYACAVAMEYYPDDPCACTNMATLALQRGDVETARRCLGRCSGEACAQNNLGVLCLIDGDVRKARSCFAAAASAGSPEAAYNLAHFDDLAWNR